MECKCECGQNEESNEEPGNEKLVKINLFVVVIVSQLMKHVIQMVSTVSIGF